MRPRLKKVEPQKDYKLGLYYSNGEYRVYDANKLFANPINQPLKNKAIFDTVKISGCGVEWCNGIDICPDELYLGSIIAWQKRKLLFNGELF